MTRVYYKDAHACIVMFDLTQRLTFQNAVKWKKDLDAKCSLQDGSPVPCLLLANKVSIVLDERGIQITFFLFLHENFCCGYSLDEPHQGMVLYMKYIMRLNTHSCRQWE